MISVIVSFKIKTTLLPATTIIINNRLLIKDNTNLITWNEVHTCYIILFKNEYKNSIRIVIPKIIYLLISFREAKMTIKNNLDNLGFSINEDVSIIDKKFLQDQLLKL